MFFDSLFGGERKVDNNILPYINYGFNGIRYCYGDGCVERKTLVKSFFQYYPPLRYFYMEIICYRYLTKLSTLYLNFFVQNAHHEGFSYAYYMFDNGFALVYNVFINIFIYLV